MFDKIDKSICISVSTTSALCTRTPLFTEIEPFVFTFSLLPLFVTSYRIQVLSCIYSAKVEHACTFFAHTHLFTLTFGSFLCSFTVGNSTRAELSALLKGTYDTNYSMFLRKGASLFFTHSSLHPHRPSRYGNLNQVVSLFL